MHTTLILAIGTFVLGPIPGDYHRPLGVSKLDQTTLDAESFGLKKAIAREDDGLRVVLPAGEAETGWKTPQALRISGDFSLTAEFVLRKLPKPAQEDGVAIGIAIATQNLDQPDATLIRQIEPTNEADVYRSISQAKNAQPSPGEPMGMMMMMNMGGAPNKAAKPPRPVFPAKGETFRLVLKREGPHLRFHVLDAVAEKPRYLGQVAIGTGDIVGMKLFASNRNGAEAVDVLLRSLDVTADRIAGLGTAVRTVSGETIHGEPTALENDTLVIGSPAAASATSAATPAVQAATIAQAHPTEEGAVVMIAGPGVVVAQPLAANRAQPAVVETKPATTVQEPTKTEATAETKPAETKPAEPKARVPLDQIESIAFERAATLSGRIVGQPNLDLTGSRSDDDSKPAKSDDVNATPPGTVAAAKIPKVEPKPNGIRDLQLSLAGLHPAVIKQVTITSPSDSGQTSWRLDTADSKDWPIVLRRAGNESWAELFLEPPPGDCHQKAFTINLTYADGQSANANVTSTEHSDPKKAVDADAAPPRIDARIFLSDDEQLFGQVESLGDEAIRLVTPWGDALEVPLARVIGIYLGMPDHKESPELFARRLRSRGTEDLLLARAKDGEVVTIAGVAEKSEGDKLLFQFQGKSRSLPWKQVEGLVLAARPAPKRTDALLGTFALNGGLTISGRWMGIDGAKWKVETVWGQTLHLPATEVKGVRFRGGVSTYVSDLEPIRVEQTPYFGRTMAWRRDVNLVGETLKIDGRIHERGVAVHSRTVLTYDLSGHFARFRTLVGFDDTAKGKGRVDCRVLADGKEIYANPDLRADAPPVPLDLDIVGAKELTLVVDFGEDQDTGDRLIWADAKLFRRPPGEAPSP